VRAPQSQTSAADTSRAARREECRRCCRKHNKQGLQTRHHDGLPCRQSSCTPAGLLSSRPCFRGLPLRSTAVSTDHELWARLSVRPVAPQLQKRVAYDSRPGETLEERHYTCEHRFAPRSGPARSRACPKPRPLAGRARFCAGARPRFRASTSRAEEPLDSSRSRPGPCLPQPAGGSGDAGPCRARHLGTRLLKAHGVECALLHTERAGSFPCQGTGYRWLDPPPARQCCRRPRPRRAAPHSSHAPTLASSMQSLWASQPPAGRRMQAGLTAL